MTATLRDLVDVRSQLVDEVIGYLETLAQWAAQLPLYFPAHLREALADRPSFELLRQTVQVRDRNALDRGLDDRRPQSPSFKQNIRPDAYAPARSRTEKEREGEHHRPAAPIPWND
jgi:hypothetical protein